MSNALALNVGAIAAVASYLVHSIFDFNLHIPANLLLLDSFRNPRQRRGVVRDSPLPEPAPSRPALAGALPVLGVILLIQCARLLPGECFSERARMAVRDQQPGLGIRYALAGLSQDPHNPDLHHRLGAARIQFGETMSEAAAAASFRTEAIRAFQTARALAPQEEIYALELASALDAAERFEEAESVFNDALQLDPNSASIRRYYDRHLELWRGPTMPAEAEDPPSPNSETDDNSENRSSASKRIAQQNDPGYLPAT